VPSAQIVSTKVAHAVAQMPSLGQAVTGEVPTHSRTSRTKAVAVAIFREAIEIDRCG